MANGPLVIRFCSVIKFCSFPTELKMKFPLDLLITNKMPEYFCCCLNAQLSDAVVVLLININMPIIYC